MAKPIVKNELRRIFESIARWKQWEILELSIQDDHIHLVLLASPRYSVSYIMMILKGKSSAWLKKKIKRTRNLYDKSSMWARGYFVSTIGIDEYVIRRYVTHQNHHNQSAQQSPSTSSRDPARVPRAYTKPPALRPVVVYLTGV